MSDRIRILLVEDSPTDAELASRELRLARINFEVQRVETFADYRRELEAFRPQVILCDLLTDGSGHKDERDIGVGLAGYSERFQAIEFRHGHPRA